MVGADGSTELWLLPQGRQDSMNQFAIVVHLKIQSFKEENKTKNAFSKVLHNFNSSKNLCKIGRFLLKQFANQFEPNCQIQKTSKSTLVNSNLLRILSNTNLTIMTLCLQGWLNINQQPVWVKTVNTHCRGMYHCTVNLQFDWIGFNQTRKQVILLFFVCRKAAEP